MSQKKISIVLSVYNEAEGLIVFFESLQAELKKLNQYFFELI
ncbi:MAG: hypothetical protein RIQ33_1038, partial [Bacteroidota bacterium]